MRWNVSRWYCNSIPRISAANIERLSNSLQFFLVFSYAYTNLKYLLEEYRTLSYLTHITESCVLH